MKPVVLLLAAVLLTVRGAGATVPVAAGPVVELPEFNVVDRAELPEPDPWLHGRTSDWQVMSTASPRATRALLERLLLFEAALRLVWPPRDPEPRGELHLVICGRRDDFPRFAGESMDATPQTGRVSMLVRGNPAVLIVDAYTKSLPFAPARFMAMPPRTLIGNAREPEEEDDEVPEEFDDGTRTFVDLTQQLCREYVRHVLSRSNPRLPVWAEEGIAQIMSHGEVTRRSLTFARLTPAAEAEPGEEPSFHVALKHEKLIPLEKFLATTRADPAVMSPIGSVWVQQAHAFAHLCFYGEKGRYRAGFEELTRRAAQGPVTEDVFQACFGVGFREMQRALTAYIAFPRFSFARLTLGQDKGLQPAPLPELREATPAEVGLFIGDALQRLGKNEAALREWRLAYARGGRAPELLGTLVAAEFAAGRTERAMHLSEKAVAAGTATLAPYLAVARARLAAVDGTLDGLTTTAVLRVLFAARKHVAPSREVYRAIAQTWWRSGIAPSPAHLGVLHEGLEYFPTDVALLTETAALEQRIGRAEAAEALMRRALAGCTDETQRAELQRRHEALTLTNDKSKIP